ncbi:MAG: hypothetical protein EOO17_00010 [Chloroflexi bacterium]|nr:MAG: hypothetical protein EOO17_00010 [Chloroflexota bacterium]
MATTKPKTTKAAAAKKPTASTAKRKTTPKATAVKTTVKSTKASPSGLKSFRLSSSPRPFLTFSITRDTIYWLILSVAILALGSWVVNLQPSDNSFLVRYRNLCSNHSVMRMSGRVINRI